MKQKQRAKCRISFKVINGRIRNHAELKTAQIGTAMDISSIVFFRIFSRLSFVQMRYQMLNQGQISVKVANHRLCQCRRPRHCSTVCCVRRVSCP